MKNIEVIAFDMDNTLIDRQYAARICVRHMIDQDTQGKFNEEEINRFIDQFMELDQEGSQDKEVLFSFYIHELKITDRTWQDADRQWAQELFQYLRLSENTIEVLDALSKKYRLALLTNGNATSQRLKMGILPHLDWFDVTMVAEEYGAQKPDRALFDKMAELLGVENHKIVYVGDHPINDVYGAVNAGMKAIWVRKETNITVDVPHIRIYNLIDLLNVFN